MKQKMLSFLLALLLTLSLAVPALAAGGFTDVPSTHWAYSDIMACAQQGIVSGFEDGRFKPNDNVTGIQFIVMVTRTFYQDELAATQEEAAGREWYWPHTMVAMLNGLSYGIVIDENAINRYDMAYVLYQTLRHFDKAGYSSRDTSADYVISSIKDWSKVPSDYYQMAVKYCYALGILSGMSDGTFSGESNMTRAQACAVIVRMMNLVGGSMPAAPAQPTTPTRPEQPTTPVQPQQPEAPAVTGSGKLANGQPATVENVQAILEEIKKEYPSGTPWGPRNTPNNNYYKDGPLYVNETDRDFVVLNNNFRTDNGGKRGAAASLKYACGGWACMVSERIFGKSGAPCREVTDASELRPGDIVYYFTAKDLVRHVAIVYGVDMQENGVLYLRTCDGNSRGTVIWHDPFSGIISDTPPELGKENASPEYGSYFRAWTRYPG